MAQNLHAECTGKGLHSEGNVAKIKPALREWLRQYVLPIFGLFRLLAKHLVKGKIFPLRLILGMQAS